MKKLSKKELQELKGGTDPVVPIDEANNSNGIAGCICKYNNSDGVVNSNSVSGCICECILPK